MVEQAQQRGWTVQIIATPAALDFIDLAALETRTGLPVRSEYRKPGEPRSPKADAIIVAPATYNTINKWANGISDTYALGILAEAIGLRIPMVVLPFVNTALAERLPFQRAVHDLRAEGFRILLGPGQFEPHPPGTGESRINAFPWGLALDETERFIAPVPVPRRVYADALEDLLIKTRHLLLELDPAEQPPAYLSELLAACRESGRTVTVINKTASHDIDAYLTAHGLDRAVDLVIGPAPRGTTRYLITQALTRLDANADECTIVSSSPERIDAAHVAEVATIGYANEPGEHERLTAADTDAVVASLSELTLRLRARSLPN